MKLKFSIYTFLLFFCLILLFPFSQVLAEELTQNSAQSLFQKGTIAFQNQKFKEAQTFFQQSLEQDSRNPRTLFNLGLVEESLERVGYAIGYWRAALFLDPRWAPPREALSFAEKNSLIRSVDMDLSFWEGFRHSFLSRFPTYYFGVLLALISLVFGLQLVKYIAKHKNSVLHETPKPDFPVGTSVLGALLLILITLALSKGVEVWEHRGTIILPDTEVLTAPLPDANILFVLHEGSEVIIKKQIDQWAHVSYPGGMTGWLPIKSFFSTSGLSQW